MRDRLCAANGNVAYSRGYATQVKLKVVVESVFTVNNMVRRFALAFDQIANLCRSITFSVLTLLSSCQYILKPEA